MPPQSYEREAVSIRLLQAGKTVVWAPGRENGSTEVELGWYWHCDCCEGARAAASRLRRGFRDPLVEPLNGCTGEREAILRACNANRHAHSMANFGRPSCLRVDIQP